MLACLSAFVENKTTDHLSYFRSTQSGRSSCDPQIYAHVSRSAGASHQPGHQIWRSADVVRRAAMAAEPLDGETDALYLSDRTGPAYLWRHSWAYGVCFYDGQ